MASLPPLSSEIFAEKVLNAQATSSAAAAKASFEKSCPTCQKTFYSENTYQNHLGSQKHKTKAAAAEKKAGDAETDSILSSTMSLGQPVETIEPIAPEDTEDPEVEAEFAKVVDDLKGTTLNGKRPVPRRPSRPHHSAAEDRPEHPVSPESPTSSAVFHATYTSTPMPVNRCLFCSYDSPNLKLSIMHMAKFHALFIPEQAFLVDQEGLVKYLQAKITENHECVFCHKLKNSTGAVQTHMRDKGHCMIAFDTEEEMIEIGQFYDFRSTYSDPEDSDSETDSNGGPANKLGSGRPKSTHPDGTSSGPVGAGDEGENEGWETDSSASSIDSAEIHALPIDQDYHRLASHRHHTHSDPRPHHAPDGFHSHAHSHHAAFHSDHELHLPTGRVAGHRSLARYYRQNLHSYPSAEERAQRMITAAAVGDTAEDREAGGRLVATGADGGLGMLGVSDAKKREVRSAAKRDERRAQRAEKRYDWGVNKRANKQKYYRVELLQ